MSTATDAHGTTIQGIGQDAGVFRYQATLSRLATTFTFTERQATALTENAREAETLARSERESMQRSQASALTGALGIHESFERTQQRSGAAGRCLSRRRSCGAAPPLPASTRSGFGTTG